MFGSGVDEGGGTGGTGRRAPFVSAGPVEVDLSLADDRGHGDALFEADLVMRQAEAARIQVVASAMATSASAADGHRDAAAWVRATLDVSKQSSFLWVRRGRLAVEHPRYLEALRSGAIHVDHFDVIVRAATNPRARRMLGEFVDEFVNCAQTLPFPDFQHVTELWTRLADDDGVEPAEPGESRGFSMKRRRDGWYEVKGRFTPEQGAVLDEIFGGFLDAETECDRTAARDAGTPDEYPRTLPQRRADALLAMATQSVTAPPGQTPKPLVRIGVDWHTVQDILTRVRTRSADGDLDRPPARGPDPPWRHRMCRTFDGDTVDPHSVLEAMIVGNIQVLILDAMRNPFAMGPQGSLFSRRQREAMSTLTPRCVCDGCLTANRHLQADHVQPRSLGGTTSMDNLAGDCGRHNRWRHNHGYHLARDADGRWQTLRPDGSPLRITPPPFPPDAAT